MFGNMLPEAFYTGKNKEKLFIFLIPSIIIAAISIVLLFGVIKSLLIVTALLFLLLIGSILIYNADSLVYISIAVLPILLGLISNNIIWLVSIIFIAIFFLKAAVAGTKFNFPPLAINLFFIVFFVLVILSSVYNMDKFNALYNIRVIIFCLTIYVYYSWQYNKPIKYIYYVIIFPAIYISFDIIRVLISNFSIGGIVSLMLFRYSSLHHGPNTLGAYLCVVIPILFSFALYRTLRKYNIIAWVLMGFLMISLLLTYSRASLLGVGVALFVITILHKKTRIPIVSTIIVAVLIYISFPTLQTLTESFLRIGNDSRETTSGRTVVWKASLQAISESPLFGSSLGSERDEIYNNYNSTYDKYLFGAFAQAHNLYLNKAIEIGILAIPLFFFLFYSFFYITIKQYVYADSNESKAIYLGILGMLIALLMRSFFEHSEIIFDGRIFPDIYPWLLMPVMYKLQKDKSRIEIR